MLNFDALNKLTELKQNIRASKDYAEGTVRGTKGRYGFVVLDDEREAFLDPDQMQRVFPGDRVEVSVDKNEKDQWEATLEKLISSDLKEFVGHYLDKGKGHFVAPDVPMLSRWIFLPPKNRSSAKDTDFIRCKITRHPYQDGKCQAKVTEVIGARSDKDIERRYTLCKFQLRDGWSKEQEEQTTALVSNPQPLDSDNFERQDLTELDFVTIDAETTLDMDDAVLAEANEHGWKLTVAIADPSAGIDLNSPLGKESLARAQTVYLPGNSAPMIPKELSHNSYSLVAGESRPALVAVINILNDGSIDNFEFCFATISSKAKLSYEQVSELIDTGIDTTKALSDSVQTSLQALAALSKARLEYRNQHALVMEDRPDYEYQLNDQGKIESIIKQERNTAQRMVEEAMLATNLCAGKYFSDNKLPALFSSHSGFKKDRLKQVKKLIKEDIGDLGGDVNELPTYQALIQKLQNTPEQAALLAVLKRQLRPSELVTEPKPHLGLGFEVYANVTSPIRRFNDLYNHLMFKQSFGFNDVPAITEDQLITLREQVGTGRIACRQLEQWLVCQYMSQFVGQEFTGTIAMVNSQGIGVKLVDSGVETFVQLRDRKNKDQKVEFSPERLILKIDDRAYHLDETIQVTIASIDEDRRQVLAKI